MKRLRLRELKMQNKSNVYYCSICGNRIQKSEEYLVNGKGKTIHFACIESLRQLLRWLGYEVKEMN